MVPTSNSQVWICTSLMNIDNVWGSQATLVCNIYTFYTAYYPWRQIISQESSSGGRNIVQLWDSMNSH